jgi:site-specific DNA-methyltransferase (adenine-specific)
MKMMEDNYIDLVVTSPPYDNLRTYNNTLDWNFDKFETIAKELYRVIKPGGVVVWVVGDQTMNGSESGTSFKQALYFKEIGFNLHDTMIYMKNNFSNPSTNRYHQIFEYMFILSKGKPLVFNPIIDRVNKFPGTENWGDNKVRQKDGSFKIRPKKKIKDVGMRYNVWQYVTSKGFASKDYVNFHPATFPEKLAEDQIISWSNENDLVYDPFMGSGTVAKMCIKNNRNYIGSEISKEYFDLANKRLGKYLQKKKDELF